MKYYKSKRNFSIPDGKDGKGRQKMKYFVKGEVYQLPPRVAALVAPSVVEVEAPKPKKKPSVKKGEKKPDIRTR